ncbi:MAG: NAD(P)/FAD-dependent oxidoreductase [Proteobacteria bacterium]|nr:NAD(P)/FAD-dependent oxidoreductase [Pseudomonadota bacterium]
MIVGGGFAGTKAAQMLEHTLSPEWTLTLLDRENFITFNPLLPEVVGASLLPGHVVAPHRLMIHCSHVWMAQVTHIDTAQRLVHYYGERPGTIRYDQLLLACGANANLDVVKGMGDYGLPLKTLGDALILRNRIIARLEQAELQPDPQHRRWLTTFVVVGGGFSGVETAGELVDFLYASLKYYKRIRQEDLRVILVHSGERLLPELPRGLGAFTYRKMRTRDVDVRLNARAVRVTDRDVHLDSGETLEAGTVICTIGTEPNSLLDSIPALKNRGRLVVNPDMSVPGVKCVWAAGDCAAVVNALDGEVCPPTAQFAEAQAKQLAANIVARLNGQPTGAFHYRPKGQLSSVGHNKAVAEVFGVKLSGFIAWLLWRGFYLLRIPTLARKTRLFLEWNWAMFFPPDIAHLGFSRTQRRSSASMTALATHPQGGTSGELGPTKRIFEGRHDGYPNGNGPLI